MCAVELGRSHTYCDHPELNCPIRRNVFNAVLERSGIQKRFWNSSFEEIEKQGVPPSVLMPYRQVKEFAANLKGHINEGRGLLLKGSVGAMKTTLAAAVLHEHINSGGSGMFLTMTTLLDNIFTLKAQGVDKWVRFEKLIREAPLLVLDDLGSEHTEGWALTKVDAIIAERYNRCRSVLVTTNLTAEQLRAVYAERMIDRLRSTLKVVNFSGKSLRLPLTS